MAWLGLLATMTMKRHSVFFGRPYKDVTMTSRKNSRLFGRQFQDCRVLQVEPAPEPVGLNRNRLSYMYPRPAGNQDMKVWRHPDFLLKPFEHPQVPAINAYFTHLCYDEEHIRICTQATIEGDKQPDPFRGKKPSLPSLPRRQTTQMGMNL